VRSLFFGTGPHTLIDKAASGGRPDRLTPLLAILERFRAEFPLPGLRRAARGRAVFTDVRLETPDTNEGKALSGLTRSLAARLEAGLAERGAIAAKSHDESSATALHLHVLFADGASVLVGASAAPWASPWPMGIPRLHMPRAAPSRSALKLAEAFVTFLGIREREFVGAGMRAVDLGAAPGGWTWQLAQRGLRVIAVDNARLKGDAADNPLVTHVRADGLSFRPRRPVDWLVCDIVDQPAKVAAVVADWMVDGAARRAIFNLKLPMKKRYDEVARCERLISERLARAGTRFELRLKQLYHDREEVTGYCALLA
jgi:23S rRNA (cytidine2498-2'-O)-methyltransferase